MLTLNNVVVTNFRNNYLSSRKHFLMWRQHWAHLSSRAYSHLLFTVQKERAFMHWNIIILEKVIYLKEKKWDSQYLILNRRNNTIPLKGWQDVGACKILTWLKFSNILQSYVQKNNRARISKQMFKNINYVCIWGACHLDHVKKSWIE